MDKLATREMRGLRAASAAIRRRWRPPVRPSGGSIWTVRNVDQRFSTILGVAQAILKRQQHFLAYGAMAMKPLALREIAQEVGAHESTVSRVTNNKFMATPWGMFELKYFFSRGLATAHRARPAPARG